MANNQKKNPSQSDNTPNDSLLNLKFAEAEADLSARSSGLGPTSIQAVRDDEQQEITAAAGPVDRQGQRRGETTSDADGSSAGAHS